MTLDKLAEEYWSENKDKWITESPELTWCYKQALTEGFKSGYTTHESKTKLLVEAVELWKKQVDENGGDYGPKHYQFIEQALRTYKGEK